ncbi:ABC transporter substrate-binding protein [Paenibacillus azoreducens]|uniref:ABC transporter substrate-binding protein n=1 Tax=Paenibacillus azoreducens TaxID=116718 RepID=A0A919YKH1_9BACL|nr:ABC transporter substrate-binding protein [Paenibacillus azoreducens]GIO50973.1 ABC transporter substrate-binding protein [Paenibacillus azoreducens]
MRAFRKKSLAMLLLSCMMLVASGCGSSGSEAKEETTTATAAEAPKKQEEPVKVVWWHSMSGNVGKAAQQLVDEFNAEHKDIVVQAEYQGTYDESLNKLKASLGADSGPSLIQVYEIGSRFMIDSKAITPMQQFIDADHYDTSSLEPNILNYYTFDGKLYSMPFNTSNPILYYNKDAFKAAGLDPEKPPATYEEVAEAAKKLTKSGQAGGSLAIYGWFMEQLFANQGAELVDNGNGRTKPATSSLLASDAGVKTLDWWKKMIDDKSMLNLGRKTDDTSKAFAAGQIAMTLDSTASLRNIVQSAEGKFEVGTGFLPKADATVKGGVIVGGASNWILNNRPEAEQKAAWEFIKFLAEPKSQAEWHINTGYFPITQKAYDEQMVKDNMSKYPQFQTAVDQLHQTTPSLATQGAVMGVFPEARQLTETAIEEVLNNKKTSKQALDDAAKAITSKIEEYNKTVSK